MTNHENIHYWQGQWIDDAALAMRVQELPSIAAQVLQDPLETDIVLFAADRLATRLMDLSGEIRTQLKTVLSHAQVGSDSEIDGALSEIAGALKRESLEKKIERELGSREPFLIRRCSYDEDIFEGWSPLGLLVHISPQNSFATGPMSVLEGLLSGNLNLLKTGGGESLFPQKLLAALVDADPSGRLKHFVIAARISSKKTGLLTSVFHAADGVAAWGGEESAQAIRQMVPAHVRIVEWGHRISFAYVTRDFFSDSSVLENLAKEVCYLEQQACSSPQCLYLDTSNMDEVKSFAQDFSKVLERVSGTIPRTEPGDGEMAEITLVKQCHKLEACFGNALVIESTNKDCRIFVDERESLTASPLFRSIWVKPLPRARISAVLRPMRQYLQTAGLACQLRDLSELSSALFTAGVTRIRKPGEMLGAYGGEPHDGVYALQRYCRRVSIQAPHQATGISTMDELKNRPSPDWGAVPPPVTPKESFVANQTGAQLFFKSGGSSGDPKLSTFTYDQYDDHMWLGAEGLYAAGLDPRVDRSINLFFCGGLYGGFISIFSALERLAARQFPMAAHADLEMVGQTIVKNKINVLLGMPSYIMGLFKANEEIFKKYGGIEKVFYGGEHFTDSQKGHLTDHFGIRVIRSGAYGSVDIGPMGYQCTHCSEGVHHLQQRLHSLEILRLEEDVPVVPAADGEEVGRLIFSPRDEGSGKPVRYAIGDVGHWIKEDGGHCPCGRAAPRFKLLGRTGDIFRIGSTFLNFQKFEKTLSDTGYAGEIQINLAESELKEKVVLRISEEGGLSAERCMQLCLDRYPDLNETVVVDRVLLFEVEVLRADQFVRSKGSGKLLRVVDSRRGRQT